MKRILLAAVGLVLLVQLSGWAATITITKTQTDTNPFPTATAFMKTGGTNRLNPGQPTQVWASTTAPGTATGPDITNNNYNPATFIWSYTFTGTFTLSTTFISPASSLIYPISSATLDLNALLTAFQLQVTSIICGQQANQTCAPGDIISPYSFYNSNALFSNILISTLQTGTNTITHSAVINPASYGGLPITNLDLVALGFLNALNNGDDLYISWAVTTTYFANFTQYTDNCKNCATTFTVRANTSTQSGYVARLILGYAPPEVPEPSTYALMGLGLGLIGLASWRRKRLTA